MNTTIETFGAIGVVAALHAWGGTFFRHLFSSRGIVHDLVITAGAFPLLAVFNFVEAEKHRQAQARGKTDDRAA